MIRSFRNKGLRLFAEKGDASKLSVQNLRRIERMLTRLATVATPEEMAMPGWRFHPLKSVSRYAVDASGNWRITFGWDGEDAIDVDLEDYH
jgi:proteic killer suppression protein